MRSLFIISLEAGYGGAERSLEIIAGYLQQDVRITAFASSSKHVAALRKILRPPSRVVRLRRHRSAWRDMVWTAELAFFCAFFRPDAILANTKLSAKIVAAVARCLPGIPAKTFIYVRDFLWTDFDSLFKRLDRAHILIPGPALLDRSDYLADHLAPRGTMRWSMVANPVRLPSRQTPPTISEDGYVLHLAAANLWKGHYHLIRTAAQLRDRGMPMRFISRGSIERLSYWSTLQEMISSSGLAELFSLQDSVEDPSALLRNCLCVVVASVSQFGGPESFGRTVIEAWAHGKPIVAFDTGGAHYLIEHEHDGLLVPEGDVEALADALQSLRQNPDLCRRLAENGMAKVRRSFTPDKIVKELRTILDV